ncbi:MAG TPA: LysE family translocator [Ferruginibacter sp.]|nr:LysE family translocator [Ferruginibacter sp.]
MGDALLKGLAISLLLIFSVGPVIFIIIKQSINHGRRGGFSFIFGVWISDLLWVILSNGFGEVIKRLEDFKIPIGIASCCVLIGMGIYFTFIKKIAPRRLQEPIEIAGDEITAAGKKTNYFAILTSGFIVNTLNPGVISFWVFTATSMAASTTPVYSLHQRIIIFSTCLAMNMLADVFKVLGAGSIGKKLSDRVILIINRVSGILYLAFGVAILIGVIYTLVKN